VAYRRAPYSGGRGMGDAPCPSIEQLQGIVDINDPCQSAALPISVPGPCFSGSAVVPCPVAGQTTNLLPSALGPYSGAGADPLSQLSSFVAQNPAIAWGVGIFAGLLLLSSMGRR
jgi:hypothetical protein